MNKCLNSQRHKQFSIVLKNDKPFENELQLYEINELFGFFSFLFLRPKSSETFHFSLFTPSYESETLLNSETLNKCRIEESDFISRLEKRNLIRRSVKEGCVGIQEDTSHRLWISNDCVLNPIGKFPKLLSHAMLVFL